MRAGGDLIPQAALDEARSAIMTTPMPSFKTSNIARLLSNLGVDPFAAGYAAERITRQERKAGRIRWSAKDRGWLVVRQP